MNLTRVEVSNFKGVSSLAFEPGRITVLTGRNNSGKTSLLEAVELAVDPTRIRQYGDRVESLVTAGADTAEITLMYEDGGEAEQREVEIRVPETVDEAQLVAHRIGRETGWESVIADRLISGLSISGNSVLSEERLSNVSETIRDEIRPAVRDRWGSSSDETAVKTVRLTVDSQPHTYVYIDELPRDFVDTVATTAARETIEDLDTETTEEIRSRAPGNALGAVENCIRDLVGYSLRDGHLFAQEPTEIGTVELRDDLALTAADVDLGENGAAVRLSDVEDYLIENELVDDLDTLSLDQVVYEEDGEKYQVPYEFTGEGFKTLLGLLWELWGDDTPDVLLLEEPETHMHPGYIRQFVYWLVGVIEDTDTQVFLTTHDLDFVRSFFDFVDEPRARFLSEAFRLLKLDPEVPETYDYDEARETALDLQIDLRGI